MNVVHSQADKSWKTIALFWGAATPPVKGPAARFTLDDVARAGIRLADRDGLAGVTMAAVAAELGLTTTALYRYVDAKDTMVEVMVDVAVGPPPPLATVDGWPAQVRAWAAGLLDVFLAHPWLCDVRPAGYPRCPNGLAWYEELLAALEPLRLKDPTSFVLQLNVMIRGYATLSQSVRDDGADLPPWFVDGLVSRFPRLLAEGQRERGGVIDEFWLAFDRMITAVEPKPSTRSQTRR